MTDRDEFALMAAEVFLERTSDHTLHDRVMMKAISEQAYAFADAMIEARGSDEEQEDHL